MYSLSTVVVDHMLSVEWTASQGWLPARITPYQNLSLDPATCVFHYAFECFEGMKAYRDPKGQIRLFRPDKNMARMNKSTKRIALPTFDGSALLQLISRFVALEERFIPSFVYPYTHTRAEMRCMPWNILTSTHISELADIRYISGPR